MARKETIIIDVQTNQAEIEVGKLKGSIKEVGVEAKKTSKNVDDVAGNGGAIAVLDQLTGGLATRFKDAYEASKLFNISLKATKGALLATGIGAFVVILGTVLAYWDEIEEAINGTNKKLQEQIDLTIKQQETTKLLIDIIDKEIALNEKRGKGNELLQAQRIELVRIAREQNKEEIEALELQNERLKSSALELTTREKILKTALNIFKAGSGDAFILDKQIEASKVYLENQDTILKAKAEQLDLEITLFDLQNPKSTKKKDDDGTVKIDGVSLEERRKALQEIEDLENEYFISRKEQEEQEEIAIREKYFTAIERAKEFGEETFILEEAQQNALQELKDKYIAISEAKDKKARDEAIRSKKAETDALKAIQDTQFDNLASGINLVASLDAKSKKLQAGAIIAENAAGIAKNIINTNAANARLTLETGIAAPAAILANNVRMGIGIAASVAATAKGLSALGGG